jgi:hypothetical protein
MHIPWQMVVAFCSLLISNRLTYICFEYGERHLVIHSLTLYHIGLCIALLTKLCVRF